jgi:hypothetical protein
MDAGKLALKSGSGVAAFKDVVEMSIKTGGDFSKVRISFWQDGLPVQAIPPQDYLQVTEPLGWNA